MFWDICTRRARLTKRPKLVPDIFSKSVPFVPSHGDASKRYQNTFQIERSYWKDFSSFACVPTAWYKRDRFTENVWYKLRSLSQPCNSRTNIPKHASGPISWLIPKCKQYKLRPPQILQIPRSRLFHLFWIVWMQKYWALWWIYRAVLWRYRALWRRYKALLIRSRVMTLYRGNIGLCGGYVGLYCGDIGLVCGNIGLFCGYIGIFCGYIGLYCGDLGFVCGNIGLYSGDIGLFCGIIGLFCGDVELFWSNLARWRSIAEV